MKNPFSRSSGDFKLPRNNNDLSFSNLFTTEFGRITPILCQECVPGDSFKISSGIGIQAMPTIFPLQTKIRVEVSYFYCRNRTVYDEFEDYIFRTKELVAPWLRLDNARLKQMCSTGSLGDFLGCSTTKGTTLEVSTGVIPVSQFFIEGLVGYSSVTSFVELLRYNTIRFSDTYSSSTDSFRSIAFCNAYSYSSPLPGDFSLPISYDGTAPSASPSRQFFSLMITYGGLPTSDSQRSNFQIYYHEAVRLVSNPSSPYLSISPSSSFISVANQALQLFSNCHLILCWSYYYSSSTNPVPHLVPGIPLSGPGTVYVFGSESVSPVLSYLPYSYSVEVKRQVDATDDLVIATNKYLGSSPLVPLSAFPFRHYEQVMNYYFRNDINNPYILNGEVQYNEFIPTHAGGPDDNVYDFHYHNWELDRFTSAQQSPQFGPAPLVGLSFAGNGDVADLVFKDNNGNDYGITVGLDGDKIINIADFSKDIPSANLRQLMNAVNYGVSINDLRMGNAYQRFKENMLRRGLRYRNQLKSHTGVNVDYPDIDVPQYIGGYSGVLDASRIVNTADSPNAGLGDFVGNLSGTVSSRGDISIYCPEHGFILGVMSIVPVPVYPQSTKKYLLKHDPFEYFLPEFGKIGKVPIHYSEVCTHETSGQQSPDDVFGYQKAWYEYMQNLDEVHGDFRTSLHDFVLQRTFASRPELGNDFVRVNPSVLNHVFVTNNIADEYGSTDKFMVNCQHAIVSKSQIPVYGNPSLE